MKSLRLRALQGVCYRKPVISPVISRYYSGFNNTDFEFSNLIEMQIKSCQRNKERPLFGTRNFNGSIMANLREKVDQFRGVLAAKGIKKNDTIALISNNRVEWAASLYAANGLGAQIIPMYEAQTASDWEYIIEDGDCKLLLAATDKVYRQTLKYVGKLGKLESILCFDATSPEHSLSAALAEVTPATIPPVYLPSPDDLTIIIYTSGTTGKPKGVELSHRNIVANLLGLKDLRQDDLNKEHRSLAFLPWAHVFGLTAELHSLLAQGSSMGIVANREQILDSIGILQPTMIASVPMMFNRIYDGVHNKLKTESPLKQKLFKSALEIARERNRSLEYGLPVSSWLSFKHSIADKVVFSKIRAKLGGRLQWLGGGGAAAGQKVLEFFEDIGIPITEGYGLTETSPVITASSRDWNKRRLGTVGVVLKGNIVKIVNPETLQEVPLGDEGEIICHGDNVMVGYRKNEAANKEVFFEFEGKRYFRTGDMGKMVDGKFLKITGRIKEQYKLENGKYVVPAPLEDIYCRSPFIDQMMLYGANKPFNTALLVLNLPEIIKWAQNEKLSDVSTDTSNESGMNALVNHPRVVQLINSELERADVKGFERPKKWVPLLTPFSQENQMLTPKMSLRRNNILKAYTSLINDMYANKAGYELSQAAQFQL